MEADGRSARPASAATWYSNTTRFSSGDPYESAPNAASSNRAYVSPSWSVNARMIKRSVSSVRISEIGSPGQRRERLVVLRAEVFPLALVFEVVFLLAVAFEVRLALGFALGFTCSGSFLYPAPRFQRS